MSKIEPHLNPDDPQRKGNEAINSTGTTTTNQLNGELNIDKLYPEIKDVVVVQYENPFSVNGGGCMKQYHFMSKPGNFPIYGKNPIDALRNGLNKLENNDRNIYNNRRQITVNLQRNSNRANKQHKFMVKIFKIDHPVYKYKIEIWKF
jgi:hypothetical protein